MFIVFTLVTFTDITIGFVNDPYSAPEGDGGVNYIVQILRGRLARAVTIMVSDIPGTAARECVFVCVYTCTCARTCALSICRSLYTGAFICLQVQNNNIIVFYVQGFVCFVLLLSGSHRYCQFHQELIMKREYRMPHILHRNTLCEVT